MRKIFLIFLVILFCFFSCKKAAESGSTSLPLPKDTLRVATMYGATSYFYSRDQFIGYDCEMAQNLAKYMKLPIKFYVAKSISQMAAMLDSGKVDLAAYNIVFTKNLMHKFSFVFRQPDSHLVLIQKNKGALTSLTQLNGKTVTVLANSVYADRIKNINQEIGGGINIAYLPDALTNADLIILTAKDSIKYTLAFDNEAQIFTSDYPNLNLKLDAGFDQRSGWLVSNKSDSLKKTIEKWEEMQSTVNLNKKLYKKYWVRQALLSETGEFLPRGNISKYDKYFKEYAKIIGYDWRLIAALAYHESRFNTDISGGGAVGLMQLMPVTARKMGLADNDFYDPKMNIKAGVKYLKFLDDNFKNIKDKNERMKFVIASYNAGPAHIYDAIALAEKYGRNPEIWDDNVEYYLLMKSESKYYNDPIVKYGYFSGKPTVNYVKMIFDKYHEYLKK